MGRGILLGAGIAIALSVLVAGCGGGDGDSAFRKDPVVGTISVEPSGSPTVGYDASRGRTTIVTQYVVRAEDGVPLGPSDITVEMRVDGRSIDNESILQESSEELGSSLLYALVLDASGSMLQHTPPAFVPMKDAARSSVQQGQTLWTNKAGTFNWDLCWFNDFVFHRQEPWTAENIREIPEPPLDAATKLYAAVEFMADTLHDAYVAGAAAGPRDNHVMVVFSDGADNLSGFDNSDVPTTTSQTLTGARYDKMGWKQTTLNDATAAIQAHPQLTVHVLAMGSKFLPGDIANLKALATAGDGLFLQNPSSEGTEALFDRVTKEFSTLQTSGASIPQQFGDHEFTLVVRGNTGGQGAITFRYRAGPDAQVL